MTDYKNLKLIASSSPHIRSNEDTRSIMLDVIIALLPALAWSVYCFGWKALLLTAVSVVFFCTLSKIILVYKIISCIIRRINIDHLYFSKVCLLKQFQYFQIISLDVEIFCSICILTILWNKF